MAGEYTLQTCTIALRTGTPHVQLPQGFELRPCLSLRHYLHKPLIKLAVARRERFPGLNMLRHGVLHADGMLARTFEIEPAGFCRVKLVALEEFFWIRSANMLAM